MASAMGTNRVFFPNDGGRVEDIDCTMLPTTSPKTKFLGMMACAALCEYIKSTNVEDM
jgi:hypothetical protein